MCCKTWFCIPNFVLVMLGVIFGVANAMVWYYGYIPYVRPMIPFALAFAVILFIITVILKARCGNMPGELILTSTCASLRRYSPLVMISAAVFIIFSFVVMATYLPDLARTIIGFVGTISFWTMLFEFLAMIFCMLYRR